MDAKNKLLIKVLFSCVGEDRRLAFSDGPKPLSYLLSKVRAKIDLNQVPTNIFFSVHCSKISIIKIYSTSCIMLYLDTDYWNLPMIVS